MLIHPGGNKLFKCFKFDPPLHCENLIFQIVKLAVNSLDNAFLVPGIRIASYDIYIKDFARPHYNLRFICGAIVQMKVFGDADFRNNLKGDYKWKWNYIAPTVDITFNLSNLISGVNPKRVFSVGAFAGIGANIAWGNSEAQAVNNTLKPALGYSYNEYTPNAIDPRQAGTATQKDIDGADPLAYLWDGTKTRLVLQAGLTGDIKINDQFAVTLEVSANTLNDKYNSKKAKNWDWYFNALAGLKINFGPTYSTKFIPAPEPEIRYVEKIVEKQQGCDPRF